MAIRFSKYINITSAVGAATPVANREFCTRFFTTNQLLPSQSFIEFDTADEVGNYFGTASEEYLRALFYFSWISKNVTKPQLISFARWVDANTAPMIFGETLAVSLNTLKLITNGSFTLTLGAITHVVSALDFSGAANLAAIATILQVAIRAADVNAQWASALVTFDVTSGGFNLVGGSAVAAVVSVAAGNVGTNIATTMGWFPESVNGAAGAIWSDGSLEESITDVLTESAEASNNFGSFAFLPTLSLDQITEAATWNNGENVSYMYLVPVANLSDATTDVAALLDLAGVAITKAPLAAEYPEQIPGMIFAATDYNKQNATQNYMFQTNFPVTPSVTTDAESDALDALRVNYYGITQQAGQQIAFYQRGFLQGLSNAPIDMNVYANEIWLKDAIGVSLMSLLLNLPKIPANNRGRAQILTTLQTVINLALLNGTISVGTVLTNDQILFITEITGDDNAFYQIQDIGYWVNCTIVPVTTNSIVEYQAQYTLVYKKDDVVRSVQGTQILI